MAGKSVRLFLIDGTPQGMRTAEVGNWNGLALVCPRTDLARFRDRPEVRQTGVYLLVGRSETAPSEQAVYVGEGDDVWERLRSHDDTKDFWTWVAVFVAKDASLTKAHARWLEATLIQEIKTARATEIKNGNEPDGGRLPEADVADMQAYLENVRLLLPTLGANVFAEASQAMPAADASPVFELKWAEARAECVVRNGRFVVIKGSTARAKEVDALQEHLRAQRARLLKAGILVEVGGTTGLLRFAEEYPFESPSAAAGVVAGVGLSGPAVWKLKGGGLSYKEWQERELSGATASATR